MRALSVATVPRTIRVPIPRPVSMSVPAVATIPIPVRNSFTSIPVPFIASRPGISGNKIVMNNEQHYLNKAYIYSLILQLGSDYMHQESFTPARKMYEFTLC